MQELYYDFLSSDLAGSVVEFGTQIISVIDNMIDSIGSISTVIVGLGAGAGIKGLISAFSNLTENGTIEAGLKGISAAFMNFGKTFQSAFMGTGTGGLTSSGGILAAFGQGLDAFWKGIGPVGQVLAVIAGVSAAFTAINNALEEQRKNSEEAANAWSESNDSVEDYKSRIEELDTALASGTLSEQEAYEAKQELYSIQGDLNGIFGSEADALDLVNGKYEDQIELIDQLSARNAQEELQDNSDQIMRAENAIEGFDDILLGTVFKKSNREAINEIIEPFSDNFSWNNLTGQLFFSGTAEEAQKELQILKDGIADLQIASDDENLFKNLYSGLDAALEEANERVKNWGTIYDTSLQERVVADTALYGEELTESGEGKVAAEWLQDYYNTIDEYNQALAEGDQDRILETEEAYNQASADIHALLDDEESGFSDFSRQVEKIEDTLDSEAASVQHFREVAAGGETIEDDVDQQIRNVVDKIKAAGYDEIELKTRIVETSGLEETTSVFAQLMSLADQFNLSMDDIVDILVDVGAVASSTSDEIADVSGKSLWSLFEDEEIDLGGQIDDVQSKISSLNSTLDDVRNGESIDWADLVPEYQVSGNAETLEQELTEYGLNTVKDFVKGYNETLDGIEDPEQLQQSAAMIRSILESLDLSSIDFSDFEAVGELIQSNITDAMGKSVVGGLLQDYYGDEEAYEIMLRVSLDSSSSQKSRHEWDSEIEEWRADAEESLDGTLSGIFTDAAGNETEFAGAVDKYKDDIEELNEAIAQLQNGEQVDLQQLVTDFPELSNYVNNLEEGLSHVSAEEIKDLGTQLQEEINSAMAAGMSENEAQALNDMFAEWIASADISGIISDDFWDQIFNDIDISEAQMPALQDIIDKYGENEVTAEVLWKMVQLPSFDNESPEEWIEQFDEMYELCVVASVDSSALDQLQNDLSKIQTQADDIQNEMSRNETYGIQNGEQMYRDLINNGNLQLQNLQEQKAMWEEIAAAADPLGADYAEAQSEIASINSEINSVIASQYEWNAAADALSYEAGEALSAYNEANSSRNAGDNYKDMKSAFEAAEELYEEGLVGTDEFQAAAAMLSPNGMTDWVSWEQNYAKATRYFTDDNSGLINFFEDLSQKTNDAGEALASFDEATGSWSYNIDDIADSADQLGISMEAFQAIMGRAEDYGFTNDWFATVEDGVNHLGDLYTDLAEAEIKLQDLEQKRSEGSTSVTDEVIQAQKDEIETIKSSIVESTDLLSKTTDQFEEQATAQYQALTTMLDKSMDIEDERIRNTYLQNVKDWAEQNGLDVSDLFKISDEGQIDGIVAETLEDIREAYGNGEYELDFDTTAKTMAQSVGEALTAGLEDSESGIQEAMDSIVESYSPEELEAITFNDQQYTEGLEAAESEMDNLLAALNLGQEAGETLAQILAEYGETHDIDAAIEKVSELQQAEETAVPAAQQLGESLVDSFKDANESGQTTEEMFDDFVDKYKDVDLSQIVWGNGEYEAGFEDAEAAVDSIAKSLGIAQEDAGALADLLMAYAETGNLEAAIQLIADTSGIEEAEQELSDEEISVRMAVDEELEGDSAILGLLEAAEREPEIVAATLGIETDQIPEVIDYLNELQEQANIEAKITTFFEDDGTYGEIEKMNDEEITATFGIEGDEEIAAFREQMASLEDEEIDMTVKLSDSQFKELIESQEQQNEIPITVDAEEANGEIQTLQSAIDELVNSSANSITIEVDTSAAASSLSDLQAQISEIMAGNGLTVESEAGFASTEELVSTYSVPITGEVQSITVSAEIDPVPINGELSTIDVSAEVHPIPVDGQMESISVSADVDTVPVTGTLKSISVDAEAPPIPVSGKVSSLEVTATVSSVPIKGNITSITNSVEAPSADMSGSIVSISIDAEVPDADGVANYSVGDYPPTVPDADGIANYTLGTYPTSVPPVTGTANYVLGSYPTSLPTITQTVVQNVVTSGGSSSGATFTFTGTAYSTGSITRRWEDFKNVGAPYLKGLSYANGTGSWNDWSIHQDEDALVNEFGTNHPESIVRNGKWMVIPGGAHVESLKKGDIVC